MLARAAFGFIASVGLFLTVLAGPADAHARTIFHGSDYASVPADHRGMAVCDRENDGHYVWADWRNSIDQTGRLYDGYGGSCVARYAFAYPVVIFRICEQSVSCTSWVGS
jgi:hypothetical protein